VRSFNWSSKLRTKGRVVVVVSEAWRDAEHELGEQSSLQVGDCWVVELSLDSSIACQDRYSRERSFTRPVRTRSRALPNRSSRDLLFLGVSRQRVDVSGYAGA
jgi:hypothetical protein